LGDLLKEKLGNLKPASVPPPAPSADETES